MKKDTLMSLRQKVEIIGEELDTVKQFKARADREIVVLKERLATAQADCADWDRLIIETGGNVNDGKEGNYRRIVISCRERNEAIGNLNAWKASIQNVINSVKLPTGMTPAKLELVKAGARLVINAIDKLTRTPLADVPRLPCKLVFTDGTEIDYVKCDECGCPRSPNHRCAGCEAKQYRVAAGAVKATIADLMAQLREFER